MANPASSVDVPLSIFSGLDTELSPSDVPEGASPANNDVAFTPGAVSTRAGLNRVFAVPIDSLGPITYQKSFVLPAGNVKNLYLTKQDGILWVEDLIVSPGVAVSLFESAGATYASSCTAGGREYIALSDGVHGYDIPLCYDGTNLWRVTQDGPGAPPTVTSVALPTQTLAPTSAPTGVTLVSITTTDPVFWPFSTFQYFSTITVVTATPSGVSVGQSVTFSGTGYSLFNATFVVSSISSPTQYVCTVTPYEYRMYQTTTGGTETGGGGGGVTLTRLDKHGFGRDCGGA